MNKKKLADEILDDVVLWLESDPEASTNWLRSMLKAQYPDLGDQSIYTAIACGRMVIATKQEKPELEPAPGTLYLEVAINLPNGAGLEFLDEVFNGFCKVIEDSSTAATLASQRWSFDES